GSAGGGGREWGGGGRGGCPGRAGAGPRGRRGCGGARAWPLRSGAPGARRAGSPLRVGRADRDSPSTNAPAEWGLGPGTHEEATEPRLLLELARRVQHHLTTDQRGPRSTADLPALIGREARDAEMLGLVDGPLRLRVPDREVCVTAHADGALARIRARRSGRGFRTCRARSTSAAARAWRPPRSTSAAPVSRARARRTGLACPEDRRRYSCARAPWPPERAANGRSPRWRCGRARGRPTARCRRSRRPAAAAARSWRTAPSVPSPCP